MTYDNRANTGALFRNDSKAKDEQPDYRGSLDVRGQAYWISAWLRTSREGKKYMSLSVQPKESASRPGMPDEDERRV